MVEVAMAVLLTLVAVVQTVRQQRSERRALEAEQRAAFAEGEAGRLREMFGFPGSRVPRSERRPVQVEVVEAPPLRSGGRRA